MTVLPRSRHGGGPRVSKHRHCVRPTPGGYVALQAFHADVRATTHSAASAGISARGLVSAELLASAADRSRWPIELGELVAPVCDVARGHPEAADRNDHDDSEPDPADLWHPHADHERDGSAGRDGDREPALIAARAGDPA